MDSVWRCTLATTCVYLEIFSLKEERQDPTAALGDVIGKHFKTRLSCHFIFYSDSTECLDSVKDQYGPASVVGKYMASQDHQELIGLKQYRDLMICRPSFGQILVDHCRGVPHTQRRNEGGAKFPGRRITAEGAKNVTSTFFNTVHLLPKDLKFENGGAKLASCPGRHLASLGPAHTSQVSKLKLFRQWSHFYNISVRAKF